MPVALAPGMGLNAYFAYQACLLDHSCIFFLPWTHGLCSTTVFYACQQMATQFLLQVA